MILMSLVSIPFIYRANKRIGWRELSDTNAKSSTKRQNMIEEKRSTYNQNPSCRNSKANCSKRTTNVALQLTPRPLKQTMAQATLSKLKSAPQCQQTAPHTTDSDTTHIFISGAHCEMDEAQVKAHLDVMNVTGCIVKDVSLKNHHRDWKSYKVTVPSHHAKQIFFRDNWPDGIRVRPFHPSRRNHPFQLKRTSCDNNCNEEQRHGHNQYSQRTTQKEHTS